MANKIANRVKMTVASVASSGTGDITLGSSVPGYLTFAEGGVSNADTVPYVLEAANGDWEIGVGTYTSSGTVLSRTSVTKSAIGGVVGTSKITASSTTIVMISPLAADLQSTDTLTSGTLGVARGGTGQNTYTIGDMLYASATGALSALAAVATGNALISGGVGTAPSWGKVGLTTHVSGTLSVANGGTGITSFGTGVATALGNNTNAASGLAVLNGSGYLAVAQGGTGIGAFGTGVATALGNNTNGASGICVQDANGNVSLGTAAYSWRSNSRAFQSSTYLALWQQADGSVNLSFGAYEGSSNTFNYKTTGDAPTLYSQISGEHRWFRAASGSKDATISFTQAMTLDSSGNLLVGTTSSSFNGGTGIKITPAGDGTGLPRLGIVTTGTNGGGYPFSIYSTGSSSYRFYVTDAGAEYAVSNNLISDQSLKENIRNLDVGLTEIQMLKPRRFDWKADGKKNVIGFIAQEIETVLPDCISEYRYNDTNFKKAVAVNEIMPVLVKAIQELAAKVSALEAKQ